MIFLWLEWSWKYQEMCFLFGVLFVFLLTRSRKQLFNSFCSHWLCICLWLCAGGKVSPSIWHVQLREILGEVTMLRTDLATQVLVRPTAPFNPFPVTLVPIPSICSLPSSLCGMCTFPVLASWWVRDRPSCKLAPRSCSSMPSCKALSTHSWPFVCSSECSLWVTWALPFPRHEGTCWLIWAAIPARARDTPLGTLLSLALFSFALSQLVLRCSLG